MKCLAVLMYSLLVGFVSAHGQGDSVQLHFELDGRALQKVVNFGLRGNVQPLQWNKTYLVNDPDGDGIYTASFKVARKSSSILEYKMVFGDKRSSMSLKVAIGF